MKGKAARQLVLSLVAGLAVAFSGDEPPRPRSVVLISIDTLRADRLGAYGYADAKTPAIDALAAESIRFEQAYAHASSTLPSIASLLTGQLPAVAQTVNNLGRFAPEVPTLATRLSAEGHATAGFVGNWVLRRESGAESGFEIYTDEFLARERNRNVLENPGAALTDQAIGWLDSLGRERPFFLWVHYQEPHGPYEPPEYDRESFSEVTTVLPRGESHSGRGAIPRYQWLGHGRLAEYMARYDGEIASVDREVGRLLQALRDRGLVRETMVIFTADHGESFGEDNLYCAHSQGLGEVLLRVPLTLRAGGLTPTVRDDAVRLIDVVPTVLNLLNMAMAPELPGRSLLVDSGDRPVVAQLQRTDGRRWRSIREGNTELRESRIHASLTRLLTREGQPVPLEEAADLRARLGASLEAWAPWREYDAKFPNRVLSRAEEEALRALGYVD